MNSLISVIIPTMWVVPTFPSFLLNISKCNLVGEIIIIDNNSLKCPDIVGNIPKVKLLKQESNIGVNPAWNLGVKEAKFNKLCILNDDVEFDLSILELILEYISPNSGMIGVSLKDSNSVFKVINTDSMPYGYACLFFIHRDSWVNIPESIKIFYGDNWILECNKAKNKPNKIILGSKISGIISATSFNYMEQSYLDRVEYEKLLNKILY